VELFNASFSGGEEGATSVFEGERSMRDDSWFPRRGTAGGCSGVAVADSRSRAASGLTQCGRLFGPDTIVEIK
jgi:hypothetical protein